jgi:glycosyltransferase involved in cell wall biosynthesis
LRKLFKKNKCKLVITYHMDMTGRTGFKKIFLEFYNRFFLQLIVRHADKIITSSLDYIENSNIEELYRSFPDKFVQIPFGVSQSFSPQKKNPSLMRKYGIKLSDYVVGFVGSLDSSHTFKGVNYLITAISKIADQRVKALIVGDGNLKIKYREMADKLGLGDRVVFTSYICDELLPEHYNLFDIFILPSINKSEAFGLVLIEAMACGKPLIASNLKGVRSVVIPGDNGFLVEPQNAQDIAEKIKLLISNQNLCKQFSLNGLQIANTKYRWPITVAQVEEVYKKLLKTR